MSSESEAAAMTSDKEIEDTNEAQVSEDVQDNNNTADSQQPNEPLPTAEEPATDQEQAPAVEIEDAAPVKKEEQELIQEASPAEEPKESNDYDEEEDVPEEDMKEANDESTAGSTEIRRRSKRRSSRRKSGKRYDDSDDETDYSYSQQSLQTKDEGIVTKTLDRFVDLLNPVGDDEYTVFSADSDRKKKPTLMQQLDKHVLTRFGCSNNPAYIPDDTETAASQSVFSGTSQKKKNLDDPGDPGVQLKVLDDENDSVASAEQPKGRNGFLCGALPVTQIDDEANKAKSDIVEEGKKEETEEKKDENDIYSPSKLNNTPFDEAAKKAEEPATPKTALETFSENFTTGITSIKETVMTKVFLTDTNDAALSPAGDDLNMDVEGEPTDGETAEATEEAEVEVEAKDCIVDQTPEEAEIAPARSEEIPFDETSQVPKEKPADGSADPSKTQNEAQKDETNEEIVGAAARKVQTQAVLAPTKKKKKKSLISRIFKSKKSKKKTSQKKSAIAHDAQQLQKDSLATELPSAGAADSSDKATDSQPEKKPDEVVNPMDPAQSNKAKREAWRSSKNLSADSEPLVKTDSADFDIIFSKNAVDDDWGEITSSSLSTPTKAVPPTSSSSPAGVADFLMEI